MTSAAAASRTATLARLASESFDVVVVGGGITGVGTALDAASRGLRTALVERDDIASGTSSRSSKLIHGGLRYLEQFQFRLVRQALAERRRLLRVAPHLVRVEPFLVPIYGSPISLAYISAGLALYDLFGARHDGGRTSWHASGAIGRSWPHLRRRGLAGGLVYHDGVADDARLAIAVARTAVRHGAAIATRIPAVALVRVGGRIAAVRVRDELAGTEFEIATASVVDATGASGGIGEERSDPIGIMPSRGSHLVIRRDRLPIPHGMTIRVPGRVVFVVPWHDAWIVGTTDVPHEGRLDRPTATAEEVTYLLDTLAGVLDVRLERHDVVATYAGIRPLVSSRNARSTVQVSREHRIDRAEDGVIRVRGGKLTTYRLMAADAIDAVLGPTASRRPSRTADLPIVGALQPLDAPVAATALATGSSLDLAVARRLVDRYGSEAEQVATLGRQLDLLRPLGSHGGYIEAEVAWAAREESALSVDDVVARRTRIAIEARDHGAAVAPRVAVILGRELGWDERRLAAEVPAFEAVAAREYDVPPAAREAQPSIPVAASGIAV